MKIKSKQFSTQNGIPKQKINLDGGGQLNRKTINLLNYEKFQITIKQLWPGMDVTKSATKSTQDFHTANVDHVKKLQLPKMYNVR